MKMCKPHWEALREAIKARGLYDLVAKSPEEAVQNTVRQIRGEDAKFDPLMEAMNMICGNAMQAGGLAILGMKEDGTEHCPICSLNVQDWIEKAADGVKQYFDEHLKA